MNKYFMTFMAALLFCAAPVLTSCSDDDDGATIPQGKANDNKTKMALYDFSAVYDGDTIYFAIDSTAENECYVTYGDLSEGYDENFFCYYYKGDVTIPSAVSMGGKTYKVTGIGLYAFSSCGYLTSVSLPNTITYISDGAFVSTGITDILIPASVAFVGSHAFGNCQSLPEIRVSSNDYYKSVDGVLYTADGKTLVQYPAGKADTTFVIAYPVDSIVKYAFENCNNLVSVDIESKSLNAIPYTIFSFCKSLKRVTLPYTITKIATYAFWSCYALEAVICNATTPPTLEDRAFYGVNNVIIYVPQGSVEAYKSAEYWCRYTIKAIEE